MKKSHDNVFTGGFTVIEVLVVLGVLLLLVGIVMGSFSRLKQGSNDDARVKNLEIVRLALEQYRAQCKVYPIDLDPATNNAFPLATGGVQTCSLTFGDLMPPNIDLSMFDYQPLRQGGGMTLPEQCTSYHISVQLEDMQSFHLQQDSDYTNQLTVPACAPGGASQAQSDDASGWYDIKYPS